MKDDDVLGCSKCGASVYKEHIGILRREFLDERPEPERGGKQHLAIIELDHAFHDLLNFGGLRYLLLLHQLDAFELRDLACGNGMGLVPAVILSRGGVDEADRNRGDGCTSTPRKKRREGTSRNDVARGYEHVAAGDVGCLPDGWT